MGAGTLMIAISEAMMHDSLFTVLDNVGLSFPNVCQHTHLTDEQCN
jgi:hypothetical protein